MSRARAREAASAASLPIPLVAPVMSHVRPLWSGSGAGSRLGVMATMLAKRGVEASKAVRDPSSRNRVVIGAGHPRAARHPAARACSGEQNHRSPVPAEMRVSS